jgi:hypothetical protein
MLPALAVYMGQNGLGATEKYLLMTPEHFRKQLNLLSPKRGKKRWRDDKPLMQFLAALWLVRYFAPWELLGPHANSSQTAKGKVMIETLFQWEKIRLLQRDAPLYEEREA